MTKKATESTLGQQIREAQKRVEQWPAWMHRSAKFSGESSARKQEYNKKRSDD